MFFFCSLGVLHVFASGATEVKKSVGWRLTFSRAYRSKRLVQLQTKRSRPSGKLHPLHRIMGHIPFGQNHIDSFKVQHVCL